MANDFKIVITATDKATGTVRKINDSISKITRPFSNVNRSAVAFGKELNRNPAVRGLKNIGSAAAGVAKSLKKVAGPMVGITGIGVVAGLTELVNKWGQLGIEVKNTSAILGSTNSGLMGMRGAAKLAGLSSEELTGGLLTVRQTLQDAKWGRNQPALMLMNKLGMAFKYTADGSVDAIEGLKDIADQVAAQKDLGAKHTIAQAFGVDNLLPMLMKGRKGIEDYVKEANELGAAPSQDAIDRAEKFGKAWNRLGIAAKGAGNNIADAMMPYATNALDNLTNYFKKNNDSTDPNKTVPHSNLPLKYLFGGMPRMIYDLFSSPTKGSQSSSGAIGYPSNLAVPLGIRNNNPLNNGTATFGSPEAGITSGIQNILRHYQGLTLAQFVHKYSPDEGKGNGPGTEAGYLSDLTAQTGIGANQVPDLNNQKVLAPLISAMIKHENGQNPYSADMVNNTVQHSLEITLNGLPQGVTATAKSKTGANVPVRINHAMPALAAG